MAKTNKRIRKFDFDVDDKLLDKIIKVSLTPFQKNMYKVMKYLQHEPFANYKEIHRVTGVSASTACQIVHFAKNKMRIELKIELNKLHNKHIIHLVY